MPETAMKPVRYRLYTDAELGKLSERVQQALADWGKGWLADALCSIDAPVAHAGNSADSDAIHWLTADVDNRTALAIGSPQSWTQNVGVLLAGAADPAAAEGTPAAPIMQHLADTLLHSLAAALLQAAGAAFDPARVSWGKGILPRDEPSRPGSGWVAIGCRFGSVDQSLLLFSPTLVYGLIGTEPPRLRQSAPSAAVPVRRAVELQPVVLEVIAGEAELTLRDLQTLEVGDVIRLDRRLDELLRLGVLGGEAVCSGHLGAAKGHKAVQLLFTE
jgi:hypothetical protein